jgi:hypothetical protein
MEDETATQHELESRDDGAVYRDNSMVGAKAREGRERVSQRP